MRSPVTTCRRNMAARRARAAAWAGVAAFRCAGRRDNGVVVVASLAEVMSRLLQPISSWRNAIYEVPVNVRG